MISALTLVFANQHLAGTQDSYTSMAVQIRLATLKVVLSYVLSWATNTRGPFYNVSQGNFAVGRHQTMKTAVAIMRQ